MILEFAQTPQIYEKLASSELYSVALQSNQQSTSANDYDLNTPPQHPLPGRDPDAASSQSSVLHQFPPDELADISDLSSASD